MKHLAICVTWYIWSCTSFYFIVEDLLIKKPHCTLLNPRCNMKELTPLLSETPQMKLYCKFHSLLCSHTKQTNPALSRWECLPVLEHPAVLVWVRSTGPCPGGLKNLQNYICFRMCECAYHTPKPLCFPKALSMGTGTHQDGSHLCDTGHKWCISHPTFCTGDVGRSSPGHIHCISLVVFLKNMLIFSYRGLDLWPLLPTIFASINSELYSKKAPREEQLTKRVRQ